METDASDRRAVEMYLRGFTSRSIELQAVSTPEEVSVLSRSNWDAVLIDARPSDKLKLEILQKIRFQCGEIPTIQLGSGSHDLITSGAATTLDEALPKLTVSSASLLRSVGHLVERRHLERKIEKLQEALSNASHFDALTGLWNRDYMIERLGEEFMSWQRYKYPLTLTIFEIGGFDEIMTTYGFEVGDTVLRRCGEIIVEAKRNTDFAGRYGQDKFCIIFPKTPTASALIAVERIRDSIQQTLFTGKVGTNFTVECSFGVTQLSENHEKIEDLLAMAQGAANRAKQIGEGRIEVYYSDQAASENNGPKVLIIDEHTSILDLCCDVFQENGITPTAARNGREAQKAIHAGPFDLYIIDLRLSDIDSYDIIRRISQTIDARPPIIAITGDMNVDENELKRSGVSHLLHKPFSPDTILAVGKDLIKAA